MHPKLDTLDDRIALWMGRYSHALHRYGLGVLFVWFGVLKLAGQKTASSLLAHTIYFGSPDVMIQILGWWEAAIGLTLLVRRFNRIALLLLAVRLPGTFLALVLKADVCFVSIPLVPSVEGQYIIKEVVLFAAALVIGATVREEARGQGGRIFH